MPSHDTISTAPPPRGRVPVVGIGLGAQAGVAGLEECLALLWQLPAESRRAVVVTSSEVGPLSRGSGVRVLPALDGTTLEPGRAYVAPPDAIATVWGDALRVVPRSVARAPGRPIDHLFRSLSRRDGAVGVLLSGASGDGTLGARELRQAGGIAFATGRVPDLLEGGLVTDLVLKADDIGRRLRDLPTGELSIRPEDIARLTGVFCLLHEATGTDFSRSLRLSTTLQRVVRRAALVGVPELSDYVDRLAGDRDELHALHRDLLRRATGFFRSEAALDHLRELCVQRIRSRSSEAVRIWVPSCGTGEAAYSVAIAIAEVMEACGGEVPVKVLATDEDARLLEGARAGVYPGGIAIDVSPDRLGRYFVASGDDHHRINPSIRELCTFGRHDLLDDPPFSQLDLVWCPEVLRELDPVSVGRLLPRFHYALKEGGRVVFGPGSAPSVLELFDRAADAEGVFSRRPGPPSWFDRRTEGRPAVVSRGGLRADLQRETDAAILQRYAPPGVVIDAAWNVLLVRGPVGPYVTLRPGQPNQNLAHLARPELLPEIRRVVDLAVKSGRSTRGVPTRVRRANGGGVVDVDVTPIASAQIRCWLVTFEETIGRSIEAQDADQVAAERVTRLQREIDQLRESLGASLQEREEELVAAQEEVRSLGEEFHTTHEDLAHAKRELETAADELHRRNVELRAMQGEFEGLFQALDLPIVTVGKDLRIRWATRTAEAVFRARPEDVGRPIGQLGSALALHDIEARVGAVIESGAAQQVVACDPSGRRWAVGLRALLTGDGAIDGVVLFAIDIDPSSAVLEP